MTCDDAVHGVWMARFARDTPTTRQARIDAASLTVR